MVSDAGQYELLACQALDAGAQALRAPGPEVGEPDVPGPIEALEWFARAQVYATLAVASATEASGLDPQPAKDNAYYATPEVVRG